ncbi:GNAT family N-acetyltransferase [Acetivibrio straminisolvens]|jgi:GNAT superfamily N-acetyltransferase|nr:GNAT family N-acetyltransferase [Acetivibrio straminisolvens]
MKIIRAAFKDVKKIHNVVQTTIKKVYPKYYPEGVVDFFLEFYSMENIKKAIDEEFFLVIECDGEIVGTGAIYEGEIKRMFVLPEFQGRGYGSLLLDVLERKVEYDGYTLGMLSSSLPAYTFYERNGYIPLVFEQIETQNGNVLCFHRMSKIV